ncbi:MAG: type II secretion system secretin GspD [Phycisphaeraceae bacterium JB051]
MHGNPPSTPSVFRLLSRYGLLALCCMTMTFAPSLHAQDMPDNAPPPPEEMAPPPDDGPDGADGPDGQPGEAPANTGAAAQTTQQPAAPSNLPQSTIKKVKTLDVPQTINPTTNGNGITPEKVESIRMNFENAPLNAVLQHLSRTAGFVVIKEVEVEGTISVIAHQPLTVDEAIMLLNTMLKQHGVTALRNERILTIVSLTDAKKRYIPVKAGANPDTISRTDEVITQVIPLRYTDATKLKDDLTPLLPEYAVMSANQASNSLILTDTSSNVKRIVQIVKELDQYVSGTTSVRVFPLQYADASNVARIVKEVFETDSSSSRNSNNNNNRWQRMFRGPRGGDQQQQQNGQSNITTTVRASADTETNTVAVSGPADTLDVVAQVIAQLDSNPTQQQEVFIYPLKNAVAETLATQLTSLFSDSSSSSNNRNNRNNRNTRNNRNNNTQSNETSATDLAGEVTVVAEEDTNSLMVMTSAKNYERVKDIITNLDRAIPQVLIKVLVAEVTHDGEVDLGVEFSGLNIRDSGNGFQIGTDFGVASATDGFSFSLIETNLNAAIHALETVGKLDVLSRPYILTSDNKEATITVGEEVPFIRDSRTTDEGSTINTIEYEDIGIILTVTPHINPDGLVIMDVAPEISTLTGNTVPISETVDAPTFAKRSASSRVAIQNGQTIVIGGLVQDRKTSTVNKVPLLGDIPLVGELFKRTQDTKSKTELLIFITPHVADQPGILQAISESEENSQEIVKEAMEGKLYQRHLERMGKQGNAQPAANAKEETKQQQVIVETNDSTSKPIHRRFR